MPALPAWPSASARVRLRSQPGTPRFSALTNRRADVDHALVLDRDVGGADRIDQLLRPREHVVAGFFVAAVLAADLDAHLVDRTGIEPRLTQLGQQAVPVGDPCGLDF